MKITVGADPELFLIDQKDFVSAIDKIGGSKACPLPLEREGFFIQEDNVAVEFNIPPATKVEEFVESITWALEAVKARVKPQGLNVSYRASGFFPNAQLQDPRAQEFGCDPDYNAWTGNQNPRPKAFSELLRSCGGHVHVGYDGSVPIEKCVKSMDLHLGIPSILMDRDQTRRELYGKAGSFRKTSYGFEYRTLSNFWLQTKERIQWTYEQTERAMNFAERVTEDFFSRGLSETICRTINEPNPELALRLCERFQLVTP